MSASSKSFFFDHTVSIDDVFIKSCAEEYVQLRSETNFSIDKLVEAGAFKNTGFTTSSIESVIRKYSVAATRHPVPQLDIFRSDLGELLMLRFFESEIGDVLSGQSRYIFPAKSITDREKAEMPGRGLDVVGYRNNGRIELLVGEAKLSSQRKNPPDVVHVNSDSIYGNHSRHAADRAYLLSKVTTVVRKSSDHHAQQMLIALMSIEHGLDFHELVLGCCLVRDEECVDRKSDFGKMQSDVKRFKPHVVQFVMPVLSQAVDIVAEAFFKQVQALVTVSDEKI